MNKYIIGFTILITILSSLNHFTYNYSNNNNIVKYFSPTDESIFQHMKMIVYPYILSMFLYIYIFKKVSILAFAIGLLTSFTLIPCLFCLYTTFVHHNLSIDIFITIFVIYMGVNVWFGLNNIIPHSRKSNIIGIFIISSIVSWISSCTYRSCGDFFREIVD